jgi:hypothetical protein
MNIHAAIRLSNGGVGVYHFLTRTVIPEKSNPHIFLYHGERLCQLDPSEIYDGDALKINVSPDRIDFTVFERALPGFTNEWHDEYIHTDTEAGRCELLTSFVNSPINAGRGWNDTRQGVIDEFVMQLQIEMATGEPTAVDAHTHHAH